MPFNASGVFQRLFNWRDDRDAGIKILAERMDQETDGIVAGINDIVSGEVDWKGPMTGVYGTAATPAYSFQEDPNTGVYRVSADVLGFSVGGTKKAEVTATGLDVTGNVTATGLNVTGTTTLDWANVNDGAGSGADADLLDGQHGSFYQNGGNLNAGTVPAARLSGTYNIAISGNAATATNADLLDGQHGSFYQNGGNLNAGTVPAARLSGTYNIAISGNAATATNADLLDGQHGSFYQNGGNLNAGTVPAARLSGTYNIAISGNAATATNATTHISQTDNPHAVTKSQVGLGNAENTSDANKPVSTAQQTALDLKVDLNPAGELQSSDMGLCSVTTIGSSLIKRFNFKLEGFDVNISTSFHVTIIGYAYSDSKAVNTTFVGYNFFDTQSIIQQDIADLSGSGLPAGITRKTDGLYIWIEAKENRFNVRLHGMPVAPGTGFDPAQGFTVTRTSQGVSI